jgi:hypothetical protein
MEGSSETASQRSTWVREATPCRSAISASGSFPCLNHAQSAKILQTLRPVQDGRANQVIRLPLPGTSPIILEVQDESPGRGLAMEAAAKSVGLDALGPLTSEEEVECSCPKSCFHGRPGRIISIISLANYPGSVRRFRAEDGTSRGSVVFAACGPVMPLVNPTEDFRWEANKNRPLQGPSS